MKRYEIAEDENSAGEPRMFPADDGAYVLHSEAQARIEALEAALRGMLSISSHTMRTSPDIACGECDAIDAARAALSIKVGETKDARD